MKSERSQIVEEKRIVFEKEVNFLTG